MQRAWGAAQRDTDDGDVSLRTDPNPQNTERRELTPRAPVNLGDMTCGCGLLNCSGGTMWCRG